MPFTMRSKYNSTCRECGNRIRIGDPIEKRNGMWVHEQCDGAGGNTGSTIEDAINAAESNTREEPVHDTTATLPKKETKAFTPSKYQQAIFDFVQSGAGNAVVEAVAGSGKTTTLVKILDIVPVGMRTIFLAFNRHIAVELRTRAPEHVEVSTIHALGLRCIRATVNPRVRIEGDKVSSKMDDIFPVSRDIVFSSTERALNRGKRTIMRRMVALAKGTLFNYNSAQEVIAAAERYGIELNGTEDEIVEHLPTVMQRCLEDTEQIDFDDMIWMPVADPELKSRIEKYDFVLVDEAQDLNAAQIEFVLNTLSPNGRIIAVGDRHQSLYGFRGADVDAIPRLIKMLDAKILPLSISYRCPSDHVALAKQIVPQIEAAPNAQKGVVQEVLSGDLMKMLEVEDMVICRTNAPLIEPAFAVIRSGRKAIIRGADIGQQLVAFVERFDAKDIGELKTRMAEYTEKEYQRLLDRGKEMSAEMLVDKMETITIVADESNTVTELVGKIQMLFSDTSAGVVFSSIHRAKGLEARRVFILHPELIPHPRAKQEWEKEQEFNCLYVALTRSLSHLVFVKETR